MAEPARLMVTMKLSKRAATMAHVQRTLGLTDAQVDRDFGVVCIDPERSLYTILVDADVAATLMKQGSVLGLGSNPPIEPFGPPATT